MAVDSAISTSKNTAVSGVLNASDANNDVLTFSIVANGSKGVATITNALTGAFTYTPNNNQRGIDTFTFKAREGSLDSNIATVTVTITNNKPTANSTALSTIGTAPVSGAMPAADADGDTLTWSIMTNGTKGTAVITDAATGAFAYTPNVGETGTDTVTFQVTDGFDVSNLATVTITINGTLSINSGRLPRPIPPALGTVVQHSVAASGNDPLTYLWDLGDGSNALGATVLHSYSAPGIYDVTVTVSDTNGKSAKGSLQMTVVSGANPDDDTDGDGVPNGVDDDDDNDGVSDLNEVVDGTNPNNPGSVVKMPFDLLKMGGSVKFSVSGKDACSISGIIPAMNAGFNPQGAAVKIDIGGATKSFTLDAKGRARTTDGSFGLKLKLVTNKATKKKEFLGGAVPFKIKISKGSWMDEWSDEGVNPAQSTVKTPMPMVVDIIFGGRIYTHTANMIYSSKATVGGKFKK